jgi:cobaltochelatase CobS
MKKFTISLNNGMTFTSSNLDQALRESGLLTTKGRLTFEQALARIKKNGAQLFVSSNNGSMTQITDKDQYLRHIENPADNGSRRSENEGHQTPGSGRSNESNDSPKQTKQNQQPMTLPEKLSEMTKNLQAEAKGGKSNLEALREEKSDLIEQLEAAQDSVKESNERADQAKSKLDESMAQEKALKDLGLDKDPMMAEAMNKIASRKDEANAEYHDSLMDRERAYDETDALAKAIEEVEKKIEQAESNSDSEQATEADPFQGVCAEVSLDHPMQSVLIRRCQAVRIAHSMNQDALYPMLVGPAGSGKTTAARKVALALFGENAIMDGKFGMLSMNEETERSEGFGFISPIDRVYKSTDFRKVYENGGVFLLDEVDASNANALTAMNAAISAPFASFPDGMVKRHKDFVLIAAANTFGSGADGLYVGRNELDAATRDRFMTMVWNYNWDAIRVARPNFTAVVDLIQSLSEAAQKIELQHVISPRSALFAPFMLLTGDSLSEVLDACVFKGLPSEDSENLLSMVGVSRQSLSQVVK